MSTLKTSHLRRQSMSAGVVYNIEFDRKNKTYFPGEIVSGEITFQTLSVDREPLKGLKTRLVGVEEIRWGDNFVESTTDFLVLDAYSPHVEPEDGDWEEQDEEDGEGTHASDYKYKFRFELPMKVRQSLVGAYGSVKYYVATVLGDQYLSDHLKGFFEVKALLDLNTLNDVSTPAYLMKDNTGGFSSLFIKNNHPVTFMLKISKTGFIPSEVLRFTLDVKNDSSHDVPGSSITLIQDMKFNGKQYSREDSKSVCTVEGPPVPSKQFKTWKGCFKIPELLATETGRDYGFITIKYKLRTTITTSCFHENINGDLPIVIGTIAVEYDNLETLQSRSNSFSFRGSRKTEHKFKTQPCSHLDLARIDSVSLDDETGEIAKE